MPISALSSPACTRWRLRLTVVSSSLDNATKRGHETAQKDSDMRCNMAMQSRSFDTFQQEAGNLLSSEPLVGVVFEQAQDQLLSVWGQRFPPATQHTGSKHGTLIDLQRLGKRSYMRTLTAGKRPLCHRMHACVSFQSHNHLYSVP